MGPDEFHMMVNNNAYTNYMGMRALRYAADVLDAMRADAPGTYAALCEKVQLVPDEPVQWRHIADNMYIPEAPNHLFEQHDGFFELPHTDINSIPVSEFPLYDHWAYDRIYRTDMIKQPDVLMFLYLYYTKHGYEISVVGESQRTARYVGIKVEWVIVRTMLISGALCGLAGFLLTAGSDHTLTTTLVDGRGFTAVMVSWLAKFNPFVMIFTSFLLVFLDRGAGEVSSKFGLNQSFADIITGVILFFIIGCEFFINYKISFCKRTGKEEKLRV